MHPIKYCFFYSIFIVLCANTLVLSMPILTARGKQKIEICFQAKCVCVRINPNTLDVSCQNIYSLQELVFRKIDAKIARLTIMSTAGKSLVLSANFSLEPLEFVQNATIQFHNLNGMSASSKLFNLSLAKYKNLNLNLILNNSNVTLDSNDYQNKSFFSYFSRISFESGCLFPKPLPSIAFKNVDIRSLSFYGLEYPKNGFYVESNSTEETVSSQIDSIEFIDCKLIELDMQILNPKIFGNLTRIAIISSKMLSIHSELFFYLRKISSIHLELMDLRAFVINESRNQWMQYLNYERNSNSFFNLSLIDRVASNQYTFPDEDICYFVHFPINHNVITFLDISNTRDCTCTILWLMQDRFKQQDERNVWSSHNFCNQSSYQQLDYNTYFELNPCNPRLHQCRVQMGSYRKVHQEDLQISSENTNESTFSSDSDVNITTLMDTYYSTYERETTENTTEDSTIDSNSTYETYFSSLSSSRGPIVSSRPVVSVSLVTSAQNTTREDETTANAEKPSDKQGLILGLSISVGVLSLTLISLCIFTVYLMRSYIRVRNHKSEVSYEITTFDPHLRSEQKH